ncbi:hypothetical protein ACQUQU_08960 [Thalassolituus sp. LLYu03]|uniref:hypothetical protein n=1 Tax=Thalassolituus sp. LLYu03 TaxID=3421656 RepID=UPI003D26F41B
MMDSALVYVLLLAGIGIGWSLGYRFARQVRKEAAPDWIPSVEYLLAEANDASLERLLSVQQLDDDSIDLFLKLGRTLREKGEVERSIHLHQSLFARTGLSRQMQIQLELELAVDYYFAGLLDRAERLFLELLGTKGRVLEVAAAYLIELYEEEGEWGKVLDLHKQKRLPSLQHLNKRIAHAACELAERCMKRGDFLETQQHIRQALRTDSQCARAYVIQGNLAYDQAEYHEAVRCYLKAVDTDPQAAVNVLTNMVSSFTQLGDAKGLSTHLEKHWKVSHFVPALTARTECEAAIDGGEKAADYLLSELKVSPSNQGFFALVELVVRHRLQLDKSQLLTLYGILSQIVDSEPKFICKSCGFKAKEYHWRCPSCKDWSVVVPYAPQLNKTKLDL